MLWKGDSMHCSIFQISSLQLLIRIKSPAQCKQKTFFSSGIYLKSFSSSYFYHRTNRRMIHYGGLVAGSHWSKEKTKFGFVGGSYHIITEPRLKGVSSEKDRKITMNSKCHTEEACGFRRWTWRGKNLLGTLCGLPTRLLRPRDRTTYPFRKASG